MFRGLEVVEQACGVGVAMMGETLGGVATGMDSFSYREPLGVCAGENAERDGERHSIKKIALAALSFFKRGERRKIVVVVVVVNT